MNTVVNVMVVKKLSQSIFPLIIILQKFLVLVALKMALQSGFLILLQFKKALLLMKRNSEQQISEGKWLSL
jgi:hypothetical protein